MRFVIRKWADAWSFGPFVQWEPWLLEIGLNLGPFLVKVEFEGAFTKEARKQKRRGSAK